MKPDKTWVKLENPFAIIGIQSNLTMITEIPPSFSSE